MDTVVDTDEADEMQAGTAWEQTVGHGLMDACAGRPTQEGDGVVVTVFRDEEYEVFKCRIILLTWPSGVGAKGFVRL